MAGRSFEEAAQVLQTDLLEKQAMNANMGDEVRRLREANKALVRQLRQSEVERGKLLQQLQQVRWQLGIAEEPSGVCDDPGGPPPSSGDESSAYVSTVDQAEAETVRPQLQMAPAQQERPKRTASAALRPQPRQLFALGAALAALAGGLHLSGNASDAMQGATSENMLQGINASRSAPGVGTTSSLGSISMIPPESLPSRAAPMTFTARGKSPDLIIYVEHLRARNLEDRHRALMSLLSTAREGMAMRSAILQAGAVLPLVELLRDSSAPVLQEAAAAALGVLAADGEAAQSTLLRAGAVSALGRPRSESSRGLKS
eukprot:s4446_g2.t2